MDIPFEAPLWEILALGLSLAASCFFSGAETALTSLSEARTSQLIEESGKANHPLRLWLNYPERVLTTLLFGNTLANIGASAMATDLVSKTGAHYAVAIATGVTTLIVLCFCEIIPKTLSKRHAVSFSQFVIHIVKVFMWLFIPVTWLLLGFTSAVVALFGEKNKKKPPVTGAEIEYLIDLGSREGVLDDVKKQLLNSVLEFADLLVKEIMVPRTRMIGIRNTASYEETMKIVRESEHSRIPIYEGGIDNVVGILFVKDLVRDLQKGLTVKDFQLEKYRKPPFFVPELMKISRLLREFQKRKTHLAVVVDEFGGTSGVVTLEDVMEEIVGEIQDEYDIEEKAIKALADGRFLADGAASIREVEEVLRISFPEEGDYETLGGFLTASSGRVPITGSVIVWDGFSFLVRTADERKVSKVEIVRRIPLEKSSAVDGPLPSLEPAESSSLSKEGFNGEG